VPKSRLRRKCSMACLCILQHFTEALGDVRRPQAASFLAVADQVPHPNKTGSQLLTRGSRVLFAKLRCLNGACGSEVVVALCHRLAECIFSICQVPPAALGLGVLQASNRKTILFLCSRAWPVRKADETTTIHEPIVQTLRNPSTFHNPIGLRGLLAE
jgi:hypothetical protein